MKLFLNIFKHFKTIAIHKYWVFYIACKMGICWQGFWHDMSKFFPIEFFESVKYYTGKDSPIDNCKQDKGYSLAWLHHKGCNPHHYEYWIDDNNIISMPDKYAIEMFCDYIAAGIAYNKETFTFADELKWWKKKTHYGHNIKMHDDQYYYINHMIEFCAINFKEHPRNLSQEDWARIKNISDFYLFDMHIRNEMKENHFKTIKEI